MPAALESVLEKCDIYYNGELISRENILEKYLAFFTDAVNPEKRTVGIALHTGSICFDVISVVAVSIGCLAYNLTTNDDVISGLQPGEMVVYKNQRYRWLGTERRNDSVYLVMQQNAVGKNGPSTLSVPYETNKHLIRPYYGSSQITDGRGIKRKTDKREQFLSYIFEIPITEVPAEIDISVVIVADRGAFADICKGVSIEYEDDKRINLLDIVPASYFTGGRLQYQFGSNPAKAEPVIKVTGNLSTARELVLDKHGNKVIGLLVFGTEIPANGSSELSDLLRRKALKFAVVESPIHSSFGETALDLCEDAAVFACTKEFLAAEGEKIRFSNKYTEELSRQASIIIDNAVQPIKVEGGIEPTEYKKIRDGLFSLKQSNMSSEIKDEFILTAQGLLNLLNTAVFSMNEVEKAIQLGIINPIVKSPQMRIEYLWNLAEDAGSMLDLCMFIADAIERQYRSLLLHSPKAAVLYDYVVGHVNFKIAIILPKAYYIDILRYIFPQLFDYPNIILITPNRFNALEEYDVVIVVGEISNRKFDPLTCQSAASVQVLLYECERKAFTYRKKRAQKFEHALNRKLGIAEKPVEEDPSESDQNDDEEMERLSALDEYIDSFAAFDVRKFATAARQSDGAVPTSEVTHMGLFASGEQVLFSKYYSAVVYDAQKGTVTEKAPKDLTAGDVLVFTVRNDYTQNIVDTIYEKLLSSGRLSSASVDRYEKSLYWKECLCEYKLKNGFSYRDVAKEMRKCGSSLQEVTVRQWLVEDSHIVGPRDEKTMGYIATITSDPYLLADVNGYFEACRGVRHERREILKWIANAINDKLRGFVPESGSVLEVVYNNVERLSETKELEDITELSESIEININLVNRPITETEV